jgi:polar amino acid transport system permease protein
MEYTWDFSAVLANRQLLLLGVRNTVVLGLVCLVIGLFFGLFVGAARYSRNPVFHWPATAFVEVFRNTPVLVQIVWFFFAFPL